MDLAPEGRRNKAPGYTRGDGAGGPAFDPTLHAGLYCDAPPGLEEVLGSLARFVIRTTPVRRSDVVNYS